MTNITSSNSTTGEAETVKALKALCYCVIMLMSLVGNTLVIIIICRNSRMRTMTNNLIANMAISDLLFPLFAVPKEIAQIFIGKSRWLVVGVGGEILCKMVNFSQDISTAVSILSLVVIAFDRFHAVKFPFKPAVITPKICRMIICFIWVVAVGLHSPYFYTFKLKVVGNDTYCMNVWEPAFETASTQKVYFLIIFLVLISFPITVITILYTAIGIEVWKQKGPTEYSRERQRREQENRRVLKQVVTVVVVFVSCITPVTIFGCLFHFVWNLTIPPGIDGINFRFYATFIMHSNAAISPCIYFIFNKNYRRGLSEIFESCARIFTGLDKPPLEDASSTKPRYNSKIECVAKKRSPRCQYI
ncbi:neuropeptide FF receptor 2-like [Stylophora pistillata]|uniref:neuropeptide FF receptor 2-like n=1 Tax=Stylophora pistillata TaxID=50429 RepID=UPI000C045DBA|nr:neuropeptide FF receptor 2-like [Stylophora pistillata]